MNIEKMMLEEFEIEKSQLKIHQVEVCEAEKKVEIQLITKELMPSEMIESLKDFFVDVVPTQFAISIRQTKNHCAGDIISKKVKDFITRESSFLRKTGGEGEVNVSKVDGKYLVVYSIGERFSGYFKTAVQDKLEKYLYRCFLEEIEVTTVAIPDYEDMQTRVISVQEKTKEIQLTEIKQHIGNVVNLAPAYISAVDREADFVVVCGKITNLKRIQIKTPREKRNDHFYVFTLEDVSGAITCKIFQAKKYNKHCSELDGKDVILCGKSENNAFSKDIEIVVKDISTCVIPEDLEKPQEVSKEVPRFYSIVKPEKIEMFAQEGLFDGGGKTASDRVKSKKIVCFDLETTGLDPKLDTIIEIGAVEISNGVIVRKFSTLVNPKREITPIITQITGITNGDLVGQPTIEDVLGDFFKFCDGAVLCGHNSKGFDMKFIHEEASKQGYIFKNEVWDTLEIARILVKGTSNFKLGTLCEHFDIDLTNAHRAYHDAIATAQLLIEIY
ncbi:MAG: exonuclease domain-containing protein [Bacillota bacterium]